MHLPNIISAWVVTASDSLAAAASSARLDLRGVSALALIASHAGCSMEWLEPRVALSQSGTVRLVDRLQAQGLVRRQRRGRAVELVVTRRGATRLRAWHSAREEAVGQLLAGLEPHQRNLLAQLFADSLLSHSRQRMEADSACRTCLWPACGDDCPVDQSVRMP